MLRFEPEGKRDEGTVDAKVHQYVGLNQFAVHLSMLHRGWHIVNVFIYLHYIYRFPMGICPQLLSVKDKCLVILMVSCLAGDDHSIGCRTRSHFPPF